MNILVAVDLSAAATPVLQAAHAYAIAAKANLWLIHVAEPDPDFVGYQAGPPTVRQDVATQFRHAHKELQTRAEALRQVGLTVTPLLVQGPTAATLLKEAERIKADMIIVGSHGHGAVRHLLVGSVTEDILKQARCPVVVVPVRKRS